jgi:hypothetical protein
MSTVAAWGQTGPGGWNRKIEAVALTPAAGPTADSFFDIWVEVEIGDQNAVPNSTPLDLSTEILVHVNGSLQATHTIQVQLDPLAGGECADCTTTDCSSLSCGTAGNGSAQMYCVKDGDCAGPGSVQDCKCVLPKPCLADPSCVADLPLATLSLQPGDEIMVLLRPAPGALPDDESDNTHIQTFEGPNGWHRRIDSVDMTPTAGAPDSFFDIFVEWTAASSGLPYPVDLSGQLELRINGVPAVTINDVRKHSPTPCDQASAPPAGDCSGGTCGTGEDIDGFGFPLSCQPDCLDCSLGGCSLPCWCQCEATSSLVFQAIPVEPGDEVVVILRPVPGALPELPPFDPEEEEAEVPRRCDTVADCCDTNADNIRDSNCHWCACDAGVCTIVDLAPTFADMGGPFGACFPDGFANIHDKTHALKCFGGSNPCETLNIDAGGPFGDCAADGFCNLHDANHALAAFGGISSCSCPPAVMPQSPVHTVGEVGVVLKPRSALAKPGELVTVDVFSAGDIDNLQSYQLHAAASGGVRGNLELIDVRIEPRDNAAFDDMQSFSAFNVDNRQMLAGIEYAGHAVPTGAYLATFEYRVSKQASGSFVVDLRVDHDAGDQSVLVSVFVDRVTISDTTPAVIRVIEQRSKRTRR